MASAGADQIQVEVNGKKVGFTRPPTTVDGRLLVPLKEMFEAMEATVDYHQPTGSFKAAYRGQVVQVLVDRRTAIVNGHPVFMEVPAVIKDDTVYVPLRFVTESLGAVMQWDQETRTAHLTPGSGATVQKEAPVLVSGPRIEQVLHTGTLSMKPGETLEVVIYGDPGCRADVSLGTVVKNIPVPEVSPGRYQLNYTLPVSLQLEKAQVEARLRAGESSTSKFASAPISVTRPAPLKGVWVVTPAPDSILMHTRPQFTATFPQTIQPKSLRFELDGQDRTAGAQVTGSSFLWLPGQDLANGLHRATIKALNTKGDTLKYSWTFFVQGS